MGLQGWHCWSQPCPWWGHTLLVCTPLLLLAVLRFTLDSLDEVALTLNCISYLIVDLPGLTPSSRHK